MVSTSIQTYDSPPDLLINQDFIVHVQPKIDTETWSQVAAYAIDVANANVTCNDFNHHSIAVASFDFNGAVRVKVTYTPGSVDLAEIRPASRDIKTELRDNVITFTLDHAQDVMLELNGNKWKALHLLTNTIDPDAPSEDTKDVYAVRGHGFILGPKGGYIHRELGGAIHMSQASNIHVEGVTSLGASGFSLSAGECTNVHVNRYRSFSSSGNGDGVDLFCSSEIMIENCFLRNSDDTIALYSHRWDWYGDSSYITIQNCVLLPDIAHAIMMGTHGNCANPETISNVTIRNIDILDQEENQMWYQGCIAINAADSNLIQDIHAEDVRVERITRGQLFNI
ncbi:hypothetical protein N7449_004442 [Penicillium cf. viridicatum]|uniref:Endo-polygalacturonase n=1 Tax=Penicillium cf. viridicatum TaxID=2972119 RepID=A0A9W9MJD8_9EURO|nr:hypothetical protein N7449_004442 [Penicillium cf. viridicatum]